MALKFDIKSTQQCGTLKYYNCSTYCDADNYIYQMLIAGVKPITNKNLFGDTLQLEADYYTTQGVTDPSTQVKWTLNSVDYFGTTVILPVTTGVNAITLEVTDDDGNISTCIFKVKRSSTSNSLDWVAIPELSITTNQTLDVQFGDSSYLFQTTIQTGSLNLSVDSQNFTTLPQNHTFSSNGTFSAVFTFSEDEDSEGVSLTVPIIISLDTTDCTAQLTTDDISSVALLATSPSGNNYTADITNEFLNSPFNLTTSMFGINSDTFESGIWTFQTVVNKVNTNTYIFAQTIKIVLFCKEECAYNNYVATYAEEELDCCNSCKEEKEKKIILMSTYLDAIKNASACGELTKITKFINLLQRLLSNKNCSC